MNGTFAYSSDIWPAFISLALTTFLGVYCLRRLKVTGARPFAFACLFGALWALGTIFEIASIELTSKVFWIKFQTLCQLPSATAILCFVLRYAGLGRWLTRRNLILISIPPLVTTIIILTNNYHHLIWTDFQMAEYVIKIPGSANRLFVFYAYLIALCNFIVLVWLAIRSPQHRWPVAIMLIGQITGRALYMLDTFKISFLGPGESVLGVVGLASSMYAFALFRFHVFDPVATARKEVLDQMREGMLVLDLNGRIVDMNPAAAEMLKKPVASVIEQSAAEILPINQNIISNDGSFESSEISLGMGESIRYYNLNMVSLIDKHNHILGTLLLLHEVTEQKRAQSLILEQQRVVATLQERERLAHELHDSTSQVLGYVNLQSETIRKWLENGNIEKAESLLGRLSEVAREAHTDIRESILSLKAGNAENWSFLSALKKYLGDFQSNYGIHTELVSKDGLAECKFNADAEVQLLRVIQEAMTNARKHSGAHNLKVVIERKDNHGRITIIDDGIGFDPGNLNQESGQHYGLAFMKERIKQIGGSIEIQSQSGSGTIVMLVSPICNQREENNESPAG